MTTRWRTPSATRQTALGGGVGCGPSSQRPRASAIVARSAVSTRRCFSSSPARTPCTASSFRTLARSRRTRASFQPSRRSSANCCSHRCTTVPTAARSRRPRNSGSHGARARAPTAHPTPDRAAAGLASPLRAARSPPERRGSRSPLDYVGAVVASLRTAARRRARASERRPRARRPRHSAQVARRTAEQMQPRARGWPRRTAAASLVVFVLDRPPSHSYTGSPPPWSRTGATTIAPSPPRDQSTGRAAGLRRAAGARARGRSRVEFEAFRLVDGHDLHVVRAGVHVGERLERRDARLEAAPGRRSRPRPRTPPARRGKQRHPRARCRPRTPARRARATRPRPGRGGAAEPRRRNCRAPPAPAEPRPATGAQVRDARRVRDQIPDRASLGPSASAQRSASSRPHHGARSTASQASDRPGARVRASARAGRAPPAAGQADRSRSRGSADPPRCSSARSREVAVAHQHRDGRFGRSRLRCATSSTTRAASPSSSPSKNGCTSTPCRGDGCSAADGVRHRAPADRRAPASSARTRR